ncbi:uncharacterized protein LOC135394475 isoform X3 [Ornithodoros turicata]|uniref:uncharacterized protein LOC135394475 isoform X3 n=1 Tax=Ornithodoros turicata TaxID=34597 RepID=UPI003139E8E3
MKQKKRKKKQKDNRAAMEDTVSRENEAQGETGGKLDPIPVELIIKDPTPGRLRQHGWTGMLGLPLHGLDFLVDTELVFLLGNPDHQRSTCTATRNTSNLYTEREMIVEAPEGQVVGYVQEDCSAVGAVFSILDANGVPVFKVQGLCTCCISPCCPEGSYFVRPATISITPGTEFPKKIAFSDNTNPPMQYQKIFRATLPPLLLHHVQGLCWLPCDMSTIQDLPSFRDSTTEIFSTKEVINPFSDPCPPVFPLLCAMSYHVLYIMC